MHSRESHVRANKLDLQEANVSVSQFLRIRIFSLDAGSRMDGILALDMWDVWSKFQHTTNPKEFCNRRQTQGSSGKLLARVLHQVEKRSPECWKDVKSRSSDHKRNFFSMWSAVSLYISEDNEAVIKMIIKGRSPMMRHVSRTQRVAFDWLYDRITLDPKSESNMLTPKNQLADLLTKGSFTRDEWCNLLRLFNIINVLYVLSQPFSFKWKGKHHVEERSGKEDCCFVTHFPSLNFDPFSISEWAKGVPKI